MKRAFALVLAIIMVLLCATGAAAAPASNDLFSDQADIRSPGAVWMLVDLGLISGYKDGTFRPQDSITREEIAKIIAFLCEDDPQAENLSLFQDTQSSWGNAYVCYCAERGILSGDGQGIFRPKDPVTARELAKMLLVVLGEDASRYTGSLWSANVDEDALRLGIYDGLTSQLGTAISRDEACLMIYNAMQCPVVVNADEPGMLRYALDALMNPRSYMELRFGLVRYTGVLEANECADLTSAGGKLSPGMSKLAGHREFAVSSDLSLLGRTVDIYLMDGNVVGVPVAAAEEIYYTFADVAELRSVCDSNNFTFADDCQYYYNFDPASAELLNTLSDSAKITVIDHTGDLRFDVVLVTTGRIATVTSLSPLTVELGTGTCKVSPYSASEPFTVGQRVLYSEIRGTAYIRAE